MAEKTENKLITMTHSVGLRGNNSLKFAVTVPKSTTLDNAFKLKAVILRTEECGALHQVMVAINALEVVDARLERGGNDADGHQIISLRLPKIDAIDSLVISVPNDAQYCDIVVESE